MAALARPPAILDHLSALADTTRSRILLLLDRHELSVSELCGIMHLPQSTVSRHLKALADSRWISARAEGTSNLYAMTRDDLDASARRLWALVREQVGPTPAAVNDERRVQTGLADAARSLRNSSLRLPASGIAFATICSASVFISRPFPRSQTPSGPSEIWAAVRAS